MKKARQPRPSEAGSAYIIALLVLVVLTLLGLGLALISQTELQIGANELTTHRALYNAEAGINMGLARKLTVNQEVQESGPEVTYNALFVIPESRLELDSSGNPRDVVQTNSNTHFGEAVEVSPYVRIQQVPCDMCGAGAGDVKLVSATYAVAAVSNRISWGGAPRLDTNPFADSGGGVVGGDYDKIQAAPRSGSKQLYAMKGMQPWWPAKPEGTDAARSKIVQMLWGEAQ